jgi:hypothetical protein
VETAVDEKEKKNDTRRTTQDAHKTYFVTTPASKPALLEQVMEEANFPAVLQMKVIRLVAGPVAGSTV